jgi:hypothetical protein
MPTKIAYSGVGSEKPTKSVEEQIDADGKKYKDAACASADRERFPYASAPMPTLKKPWKG